MKKLLDLNKEWFDKTNEMFVSFVKRGGDAFAQDIKHLNLKRDVYLAISNLILYLADGKKNLGFVSKNSTKSSTTNQEQINLFKEEIKTVFQKFEKGHDYRNINIAESIIDLIGRRVHSSAYQLLAGKQLAELERLLEEFWINFFALTNTGDNKADQQKLDNLLETLDQNINTTLSS